MKDEKRYPIKTVSLQTGLSVHTIRAWEKRYKVVVPMRTGTNRRLYSEDDIALLRLLREATEAGHSIGSIADLNQSDLEELTGKKKYERLKNRDGIDRSDQEVTEKYGKEAIHAVIDFDVVALENVLFRASAELTLPVLLRDFIMPLLDRIGELWQEGKIRIIHEHLATAAISPFLHSLKRAYRPATNAPILIVCTPTGQKHEFGALVISLIAAAEDWRVVYLGADLPANEIAAAAKKEKASVIALSIVFPDQDSALSQELKKLKQYLPAGIKIVAGGRGAADYLKVLEQIGAIWIENLSEFRNYLSSVSIFAR